MSLEIRILSGSLAGRVKHFEQSVVAVGRQGSCELRFDAQQDLDVSGRHAEIRLANGHYVLVDNNSTNGTFVNGGRVPAGGSVSLKHGDRVRFGANGPEAEVLVGRPKASTEVRIAMAVTKQTAGLKRLVAAGLAVVILGSGGAAYYSTRASAQRVDELLRANDSMRIQLQSEMRQSGDTTLMSAVRQRVAELRGRLERATGDAQREQIRGEIQDTERQLRGLAQMDLPAIFARNAGAVAILVSDFGDSSSAGSAFGLTREGLLVTNRHNVESAPGRRARRLAVKFTDTRDWLPARIVKVSDDPDADLALIQMERGGPYPFVEGVGAASGLASEGMSVAVIGYPAGYDTPMEGTGNDFLAKSTLSPGTVSKKTSSVLQIDSFATHGSSGSPVFDSRGSVVGVVYGGLAAAGGKLVYAVPAERLAAFIPDAHKAIVRN